MSRLEYTLKNYKNRNNIEAGIYIAGWYFFSLSISIYNKWMFGDGLKFQFPIFITSFHQLCLMLISCVVLYIKPQWRPLIKGNKSMNSRNFLQYVKSLSMKYTTYIVMILPCSFASAGDIGLSNVSFKYVPLSLYTMLKTSSLVFVLIFGLLFRLEKFNWKLIIIVGIMTGSVLMMIEKPDNVVEDVSSNLGIGIPMVLGASVMSGLRWSFTQILLKGNEYTSNSISTILYLSPAICAILFLMGLVFEGWANFADSPIWEIKGLGNTIFLMIIPGLMAFMMTLCEFKLLSVAQIITLSVAGIFKELLTIIFSVIIFNDRLSLINALGLVITFADILLYNYYRYQEGVEENSYAKVRNDDSESEIELTS